MDKDVLRNLVRQRRSSIPYEERIKAEKAIFERFNELDEAQGIKVVASYNPLPEEADVSLINNFLLNQGKLVCFPEVMLNGAWPYITVLRVR